jgi:hypothetical protein
LRKSAWSRPNNAEGLDGLKNRPLGEGRSVVITFLPDRAYDDEGLVRVTEICPDRVATDIFAHVHGATPETRKDEPALLAKVNEARLAMDQAGEINQIWDKWLGPNTEYKMVRAEKVVPLKDLQFIPIP